MALGILLIFMVVLFILSFICVMLMWIAKRERFKRMMISLCFVLSLVIVWISFTSLPTNYFSSKLISWMIGGLSILGMIQFYKQKLGVAKVMMTVSICLGILQLFFF